MDKWYNSEWFTNWLKLAREKDPQSFEYFPGSMADMERAQVDDFVILRIPQKRMSSLVKNTG
jgi:hypothetical protein